MLAVNPAKIPFFELRLFFLILVGLHSLVESRCHLPWTGVWLQNGVELNITHNSIGNLGNCVQKGRDLYLLTSETSRGPCYRCLITFPVHENILHYKSTQCIFEPNMSLERCSQLISADVIMHTLFRKDASVVPCPIEAPLNFTYQSSYGSCSSRTSHMHRCSQYDRLALHYQACPEVPNREAAVWQMECIGSWRSFGQSYFAARIGQRFGEQYRCFILEKSGTSGRIGESADAGCQELTHIGAATTTLHFRQDSPIHPSCEFPSSLFGNRMVRRNWESMVFGTTHRILNDTWLSVVSGRNETVWSCLRSSQITSTENPLEFTFRTFVAQGCKVGYQCLKIHQRAPHILHIAYGQISPTDDFDDCSEFSVDYRDTLVLQGSKQACPIRGKHTVPSCEVPLLTIGCTDKNSMELVRDCKYPQQDEFTCVSHYKNADNDFIIVRDALSRQLICMTYISSRINLLRVYDRVSCEAESVNGSPPSLALNFTSTEGCTLTASFLYFSNSSPSHRYMIIPFLFVYLFKFSGVVRLIL
ncbi:unnamed protein product [Caenorhabditis auriculariae]|uniref:Uncharacterized protein n=1 Tax=Caenorhabditis auriculariae TaxID=2777116 RepID=A0A8S1HS91_9PELO|nr:unnamed protein product [Caenorhabditis auriculariae]